jgi:two-component system, OmpR family, response regulator
VILSIGLSYRMKLRVYLVEDSAIMSKLLRELVQSNGASIVGHSDAAQTAISDIEALGPDVVVIDIALRKGNGFDILKSLRDRPGVRTPLRIVLTNYALASYRNAAKRMGAEYFFDKSSQIPELLRVVRALSRSANRANGAPA